MTMRHDLTAAKSLIDTPEKWCKGGLRQGNRLTALGALNDACNPMTLRAVYPLITALLPEGFNRPGGIKAYNDAQATIHADIMALFDRAIDAALTPEA